MNIFESITMTGIDYLSTLFIFVVGLFFLAVAVTFVIDISQSKDAIRKNYPVIGRFRYLFSTLGEFFRQYFFAMDREEMPFNRAERSWAYRAAKGEDTMVAFGSTRDLRPVGTLIFVNDPYPPLAREHIETAPVTEVR